MLRKMTIPAAIFSLLIISSAFAQTKHTRLLYYAPLTSNAPNDIGTITSSGGSFSANGWTAQNSTAQLRIDCTNFLPFEGTMEVTVRGLMPTVTNEWIPIALHSRGAGNFDLVDPSPASYAFLKTDQRYAANNLDFKFFSAAFYGANSATARKDSPIYKRTWDKNKDYKFYIVWDRSKIKLMLGSETLAEQKFEGQVESFGYIFLGRDDYYKTTTANVSYRDLRIWAPETSFPFTNIAKPLAEMADKKIGGQGVLVADVDQNGYEDFYISRFMNAGVETPNLLYVQNTGLFQEESTSRRVADNGYSYQTLAGDFDADGDQDLFVVNYYRSPDYVNQPNALYLNDGSGNFTDATSKLSGNVPADYNSGTLIDIDRDGDLDVVVVGQAAAHKVYVNDGRGNLVAESRGLENFRSASFKYQAVVAGDLNGDGFQDLVLVHETGIQVAKNNGAGTFVNGVDGSVPSGASCAALSDIDNDGDLDILVGSKTSGRVEMFRNDGTFVLSNISTVQQIAVNAMSILPGDWNNDGREDLFLIGFNSYGRLFINEGGGRFAEKIGTGVEANFADGRGAAALDVNGDGRLDIYAVSRGDQAVDDKTKEKKPYGRNYLFRNDIQNGRNYLQVKVADQNGNASGLGAKIYLYQSGSYNNPSALIGFREILSNNGFKSQSSPIQHFGVDQANAVDVKVLLPDGTERKYTNVAVNQMLTIAPKRLDAARLVRDFNFAQTATVGKPYELVYRVLTTDDDPVPGHPVTFTVTGGNGSLDAASVLTSKTVAADETGRARIQWYLGPTAGGPGMNQMRTTSELDGTPLSGSPDVYELIARADAPAAIQKSGGDAQIGFVNEELTTSLQVLVADKFGNPVGGQPVEFTVASGGGLLKSTRASAAQVTVDSDADGIARASWLMGPVIGSQSVYARSTLNGAALQNSPLTFTATAQEPLRRLSYVSGDRQFAVVNSELSNALRVRLTNKEGAPLGGEVIRFKVASSNGANFAGSDSVSILTDSQGYAAATPRLGTAAGDTLYVFEAHAAGAAGSPVIFKASAITGPPSKIVYVSGNNQTGVAGRVLADPIRVRLLDNLDNPVKNYDVQFFVIEGAGSFDGQSGFVVKSDGQGYASANWRLGEKIGNNTATASAVNTPLPQITFSATGVVGPPARLVKNGGDNQRGDPGKALKEYFVVTVTDSFYNTIAYHAVNLRVTQGSGTINGRTEVTEYTNVFGQAQVLYTMGPIDYEQKVEAAAVRNNVPLIGSPQVFHALLGPGEPETLLYISGNHQIGRAGAELTEPFVVRVVDKNGVGVPDIDVDFVSYTQGASFAGATTLKKRTDDDGYAGAVATLGSVYGTDNNIFEAIARYNSKNLKNSPIVFKASGRVSLAKKMLKLNGEQLYVGTVGQVLSDSLQVQVLDDNDQPVARHPVSFQVAQGIAFINDRHTTLDVLSDARGVASVAVKLATAPGVATIRASANDGVNSLTPAFLDFNTEASVGAPDTTMCSITAVSNVLANGQTSAPITVKLRDRFNNPIVNQAVMLQTAGTEVFVTQPALPTDAEGITRGSVASINIGTVMIFAVVNNQPVVSVEIEFVAGPPTLVSPINDGQSQEKGKTLPQQVGVLVQDAYAHPVKNLSVYFTVVRGGGSVAEPQPMTTGIDGRALVTWTLGDTLSDAVNFQQLSARIDGVPQELVLKAYALPPAQGRVSVLSGDSMIVLANRQLPEAFRVLVTEQDGKPITNYPVEFTILQGQGTWLTSARPNTNQQGQAQALLRSGAQQGLHIVRASAGSYGSVLFSFLVQDQRTVTLVKLSKDGQQVRPKTELALSFRVLDAFNRPLHDEKMTITVVQGQGFIKESQPLNSVNGVVSATWVAGNMGTQQVEIKAVNAAHAPTFFTALVINSAPEFSPPLQKNRTVESGNLVQFQVRAVDPDGDQVFYSAGNLPAGAEFDDAQNFRWRPTNADAGDHWITFKAMDQFGAADSSVVKISVNARNTPPEIRAFMPVDTVMVIPFNIPVSFSVQAFDPDNDPLSYAWLVISSRVDFFAGDSYELPQFIFSKQEFPDSLAIVSVTVTDGSAEKTMQWYIHMSKTAAVELENFSASVRDNKVELVWKTRSEKGTVGFDILRSRSKTGTFEVITPQLIAPQSGGSYNFTDEKVQAGERWYYKLRELDSHGLMTELGQVEIEIALPKEIALRQNYPNPFNPTTTIRFELPAAQPVTIAIFNMTGQLVRTLVDGDYPAGIHNVLWDAHDDAGQPAPSGIYYFRMSADGFSDTKKLLLLK